jgi:hypothetical protein
MIDDCTSNANANANARYGGPRGTYRSPYKTVGPGPSGLFLFTLLSLNHFHILDRKNTSQGHCPAVISFQIHSYFIRSLSSGLLNRQDVFQLVALVSTFVLPPTRPFRTPCRSLVVPCHTGTGTCMASDPGSGSFASVGAGVNRDCSPF